MAIELHVLHRGLTFSVGWFDIGRAGYGRFPHGGDGKVRAANERSYRRLAGQARRGAALPTSRC